MNLGSQADADLLQRALAGEPVEDPSIQSLVRVTVAVSAIDTSGMAPSPEFVAGLRERLLTMPPQAPVAGGRTAGDQGAVDEGAVDERGRGATVLRLPRRPLRLVAAAAAAIVVLAASLGLASRAALPGDVLYPVKQLLDRAAVQLAGSGFAEGTTLLAQTQQHISEARDLLDGDEPRPADVTTALEAASDAFVQGDTILFDLYRTEHRVEALTELDDFISRARPQVDALAGRVPARALPAYQRLRDLLGQAQASVLQALAQCADCGTHGDHARALLDAGRASAGSVTGTPTPGGPASGPSATGSLGPQPGGTEPATGPTLPGAGVSLPGLTVTTDGAGAGGGGVSLPGASLQLPTVQVTSSTVVVGGGGVSLPGGDLGLPTVSSTLDGLDLSAPTGAIR